MQRLSKKPVLSKERVSVEKAPEPAMASQVCRNFDTTMREQLNLKPTFWIFLPTFLYGVVTATFLELYVTTATSHIVVFVIGSYCVFSSYFVCDYVMSRVSTSYATIPNDKKFYVLSNLIKSAVLLSYSPLAATCLYNAIVNDQWDELRIRNLGVLYAIPDFVSLFLVERMSTTTKGHHICVVFFMIANLYNDYSTPNICRAIVVYGVFSTFAYLVNLLLASRFLAISVGTSLFLSALALTIYVSCLAMNWMWQVRYVSWLWYNNHSWTIYLYCALISFVVYDDIVLCKWLRTNVVKKWREWRLPSECNTQERAPSESKAVRH